MKLKSIIDNQTIDFDLHARGDGKPTFYGGGLHMHKRINSGKYRGVDILFPIDSPTSYSFRKKSISSRDQDKLISEINRVFKDNPQKVKDLVDTVIKEIERYSGAISEQQLLKNIKDGAKNLASAMGLNRKITDDIKSIVDGKLTTYLSSHKDSKGKLYYIKQDLKRKIIKMSDDLEMVFYANN